MSPALPRKIVDLLLADMRKPPTKAADARPHAPDQRVAEFALSYLDAFGYFARPLAGWDAATAADVRRAVGDAQAAAGLKRTGTLTPRTVRYFESPRCGCPDVDRPHNAYGAVAARAKASLVRWQKAGVKYRVEACPAGVAKTGFAAVVETGFAAWSKYGNISAVRAAKGEDADVVFRVAAGPQSNFDGAGGQFGWAGVPDGGPVVVTLDDGEAWTLDAREHGVCLHNAVRHLLGHALGLTHSRVPTALMAPAYNATTCEPQLFDDVQRFQARYGVRAASLDRRPKAATLCVPVAAEDAVAAVTAAGYKVSGN